jgi:hypothetical protein
LRTPDLPPPPHQCYSSYSHPNVAGWVDVDVGDHLDAAAGEFVNQVARLTACGMAFRIIAREQRYRTY